MLEINFHCGQWKYINRVKWDFVFDDVRGCSFSMVNDDIKFGELISVVFEDYGVDDASNAVSLSYKFIRVVADCVPPCYIINDRQLKSFVVKSQELGEGIQLCVTFTSKNDVPQIKLQEQLLEAPKNVLGLGNTAENDVPMAKVVGASNSNEDSMSAHIDRNDHIDEGIYMGQYYPTKEELMKNIRLHALKESYEFRIRLSDRRRVVLVCVDKQCTWRFNAYRVDKIYEAFMVQHYVSQHSCDTTYRKVNHRQATAKILGEMVSNHFQGGKLGLKPKQIMEQVRKDYGVNITYWKAYQAQGYAEEVVRGSPDENYHLMPKWLHVVKQKNPGSVAYIERESDGKFKYVFLAFGASIRGFKLLRKIVAVDGAFLKSKFRGTLLGATAQDGNFQLYPIAFGIVDSENDESWEWFFRCLRSVIPDETDLMFVSDRHQSIAKGLSVTYPLAHHGLCTFHFQRNVATRFKKNPLMSLVHEASRAYTQRDFDELFTEINNADPKLGEYLQEVGFSKWSRAYSLLNRYNIMTTNIAESLNAMLRQSREYPIVFLLETIRLTLTRWFHNRWEKASNHRHQITSEIGKIMKEVYDASCSLDVSQVNEHIFEVKGDLRIHNVDLRSKQCTCRKFDLDGYPCIHAFAAVKRTSICENSLVTDYYTNKRLIETYSESIYPVGHEDDWNVPEDVAAMVCLPPSTRVPCGRRKKKRICSSLEYGNRRKEYKCGRCGVFGHNKGSCREAI